MTVLALDTSSRAASCALLRDGALTGEFFIHTALTHSQTAMPMVEALLKRTGASLGEVDVLAVSAGPGSFTGLRIGIAAVKGLAMGLGKPCAAVSTLEGLAHNLTAFDGVIVPAMDARRSQVYTARFSCRDGIVSRLSEDAALSVDELRESIRGTGAPVMLVGDGAALCQRAMGDLPRVHLAPEALRHQRASSVASVAARLAGEGKLCGAGALAPRYLRLPQAERERLARLNNRKRPG